LQIQSFPIKSLLQLHIETVLPATQGALMVELTSLTVDGERKFSQLVHLNNLLVTGEGVTVLGLTAFGA
jgi:hypothetical protein